MKFSFSKKILKTFLYTHVVVYFSLVIKTTRKNKKHRCQEQKNTMYYDNVNEVLTVLFSIDKIQTLFDHHYERQGNFYRMHFFRTLYFTS